MLFLSLSLNHTNYDQKMGTSMQRSPFLFELSEKGSVQRISHSEGLWKVTWCSAVWYSTSELSLLPRSLSKGQLIPFCFISKFYYIFKVCREMTLLIGKYIVFSIALPFSIKVTYLSAIRTPAATNQTIHSILSAAYSIVQTREKEKHTLLPVLLIHKEWPVNFYFITRNT